MRQVVFKTQRTQELRRHISANGVFAVHLTCYATHSELVTGHIFERTNFFTCATRLHGTVQILLQIAVLFAVLKLARSLGSRVNDRQTCIDGVLCFVHLTDEFSTGGKCVTTCS